MAILKQSTAYTRTFLLVQTADHISALTGASPTVNISKAGAAFSAAAGAVTEIANGFYKIALTTTDTNTLGDLTYHITATSGDATDFVDQVCGNILGDTLPANTTQLAGQTVTAGAGVTFPASVASPTNITAASGITVATNSDKTGYSLTQTFPANFSAASIDANGNVATTSNIKKNTAKAGFMFVMTDSTTHAPKTGVTVTSTRSIDGAAFASTTNSATEVATGTYVLNLSATDTNGDHIMLRFTGTASDDLNIEIVTQP